jgi:hypothetical protein
MPAVVREVTCTGGGVSVARILVNVLDKTLGEVWRWFE